MSSHCLELGAKIKEIKPNRQGLVAIAQLLNTILTILRSISSLVTFLHYANMTEKMKSYIQGPVAAAQWLSTILVMLGSRVQNQPLIGRFKKLYSPGPGSDWFIKDLILVFHLLNSGKNLSSLMTSRA